MKAYKVTTTFLGADRASAFYFSTKAAAELNLSKLDNGEIEIVDIDADALPSEGCTWDDIAYYNPGHVWQNQEEEEKAMTGWKELKNFDIWVQDQSMTTEELRDGLEEGSAALL